MKLNPDCIRAILMVTEENTGFSFGFEIDEESFRSCELFNDFEYEEIGYHIRQCDYYGYFTKITQCLDGSFLIYDLSPKGHEFLADIRADSNWKKIKEKAFEVGSFSLNTLAQIAVNVISSKLGG